MTIGEFAIRWLMPATSSRIDNAAGGPISGAARVGRAMLEIGIDTALAEDAFVWPL